MWNGATTQHLSSVKPLQLFSSCLPGHHLLLLPPLSLRTKLREGRREKVLESRYIWSPCVQIASQTFRLDAVLSFSSSEEEEASREEGSQEAGLDPNKQTHNHLFLSMWKFCAFYRKPASYFRSLSESKLKYRVQVAVLCLVKLSCILFFGKAYSC